MGPATSLRESVRGFIQGNMRGSQTFSVPAGRLIDRRWERSACRPKVNGARPPKRRPTQWRPSSAHWPTPASILDVRRCDTRLERADEAEERVFEHRELPMIDDGLGRRLVTAHGSAYAPQPGLAKGELPYLDADPICGCQDLQSLTVWRVQIFGDLQRPNVVRMARVEFTNAGEAPTVLLALTGSPIDGWRIDDVVDHQGVLSLAEALAAANAGEATSHTSLKGRSGGGPHCTSSGRRPDAEIDADWPGQGVMLFPSRLDGAISGLPTARGWVLAPLCMSAV